MGELLHFPVREQWLNREQLAQHLGYSSSWIRDRMREGMPYEKRGGRNAHVRFRVSEVEAWLDGRYRVRQHD